MNPVTWPERAITKAAAKRLEMRLYRFWLRSPEYKSELAARTAAHQSEAEREREQYMARLPSTLGAAYVAKDCKYLGYYCGGYMGRDSEGFPLGYVFARDFPTLCRLDAHERHCEGKCNRYRPTTRPTWKRKAAYNNILFPPYRFTTEQVRYIDYAWIYLGFLIFVAFLFKFGYH